MVQARTGHNQAPTGGTGGQPKLRQTFAHDSEFAAKVKQEIKCKLLEEKPAFDVTVQTLTGSAWMAQKGATCSGLNERYFFLCGELYGILTVEVTDPFGKKHCRYATQPWIQTGKFEQVIRKQ